MKILLRLKKHYLHVLCAIFSLVLLSIGFNLARHKPLWTDEIYSQTVSISRFSYLDIFLGRVKEGNTCPLFYLMQKVICAPTPDQRPSSGLESWDQHAQFQLRISPVFFMSAAMVAIFYWFARYYSLPVGIYALGICLSSPMVWSYWAEARPYALWFFLTTLQSLLFLSILRQERLNARLWRGLAVSHWLLALTVITSMGQILAVSALLWVFKERSWKRYLSLTALPLMICLYYYGRSSLSPLWVPNDFMRLIYPSVSAQQMGLFVVYTVFLVVSFLRAKAAQKSLFVASEAGRFGVLTALMLIVAFAYLVFYKCQETPAQRGHELPVRQFIFLTPVGIMATTLFSLQLLQAVKNHAWIRINVALALGGLMGVHFLRNCFSIIGIY